jgi:hypothetical protein
MAEHGTPSRFTSGGCRCKPCSDANAAQCRQTRKGLGSWRGDPRPLRAGGDLADGTVRRSARKNLAAMVCASWGVDFEHDTAGDPNVLAAAAEFREVADALGLNGGPALSVQRLYDPNEGTVG